MPVTLTQKISGLGRFARWAKLGLCASLTLSVWMGMAEAQQSFQPVKLVNNQVVTGYELSQRMTFLKLLGFSGDLRGEAMNGLVDDRLRSAAARQLGIKLPPEAVIAGMEEFAARGSLSAAELVQVIGEQGVAPETFRDFVSAGIIWREVVRARFGDSVVISDAAIDRALTNMQVGGAQTMTLAEIVLDASPANRNAALALARNLQIDFIKGRSFSDAARAVSTGSTARSGGLLPPKRLSELPEDIAVLVRGLDDGQVSKPIILDDRLYMYQRQSSTTEPVAQTGASVVDYAEIALAADKDFAEQIAQMRAQIDSCDDLYGYATAQRGLSVIRHSTVQPNAQAALQLLDTGEISPPLQGGRAVMLCARGLQPNKTASRDEVQLILRNQRLAALADVYLSELRADALIRDP